jgi:DNA-binding LacI/PurR family transcriptional regulator
MGRPFKITQRELAAELGVSTKTVYRMLNNPQSLPHGFSAAPGGKVYATCQAIERYIAKRGAKPEDAPKKTLKDAAYWKRYNEVLKYFSDIQDAFLAPVKDEDL